MDRAKKSSVPAAKLLLRRFLLLYSGQSLLLAIKFYLKSKSIDKSVFFNASNARFAISIAGLSSSFQFWKSMLQGLSPVYKSAIAGALSAPFLMLDGDGQRSAMISQAIFTRTVYFMIRMFVYEPAMPGSTQNSKIQVRKSSNQFSKMLRKIIDKYGNWIVWIALAYRVCYASWVTPELLRKSYYDQLVYITGSNKRLGRDAKKFIRGASVLNNALEVLPNTHSLEKIPSGVSSHAHLEQYLRKLDHNSNLWSALDNIKDISKYLPSQTAHHDNLSCLIQHPWQPDCNLAAYGIGKDVLSVTLPIFIKLNGASLVFSLIKQLYKCRRNKKPIEYRKMCKSIYKSVIATLRSSLMLTGFISVFSLSVCKLRNVFGRTRGIMYGLAGCICTPTILIDKPGRLLEFNTFLVAKTLEQINIALQRNTRYHYNQ